MSSILLIFFFFLVLAAFLGLFSPRLVGASSRWKAFSFYAVLAFIFLVSAAISAGNSAIERVDRLNHKENGFYHENKSNNNDSPQKKSQPTYSSSTKKSDSTIFNIIEENNYDGLRVVNVEIPNKLSEPDIEEIARKIYLPGFHTTSIHFKLPKTNPNDYIATARFHPDLLVSSKIFFEKNLTVSELRNFKPPHSGLLVGRWFSDAGSISMLLDIIKLPNGKFLAHSYFIDGSNNKQPLSVKHVNNQTRYYEDRNYLNTYYTIGADGSLQAWNDRDGMRERLELI